MTGFDSDQDDSRSSSMSQSQLGPRPTHTANPTRPSVREKRHPSRGMYGNETREASNSGSISGFFGSLKKGAEKGRKEYERSKRAGEAQSQDPENRRRNPNNHYRP